MIIPHLTDCLVPKLTITILFINCSKISLQTSSCFELILSLCSDSFSPGNSFLLLPFYVWWVGTSLQVFAKPIEFRFLPVPTLSILFCLEVFFGGNIFQFHLASFLVHGVFAEKTFPASRYGTFPYIFPCSGCKFQIFIYLFVSPIWRNAKLPPHSSP